MKKILCSLVMVCFIATGLNAGIASPNKMPIPIRTNAEPRAVLEKLWVDFGAKEGEVPGMLIHIKFTAHEMKDQEYPVAIYFLFNDSHGGELKDKNQKYYSSAGYVALYKSFKPTATPQLFEDFQLFMPYNELDLGAGDYSLLMDVKVIKNEGGLVSNLTQYSFTFTQPGPNGEPAPTAVLHDLKIDHNVEENGKKGMIIHVNFTVNNMKDIDAYLALYFFKKDGTKLKGSTDTYRSSGGQSAVYGTLKLPYDKSIYDDFKLFFPYEELNLGAGKFDLRIDADVIYKNGNLMKHMKNHEFQVEL